MFDPETNAPATRAQTDQIVQANVNGTLDRTAPEGSWDQPRLQMERGGLPPPGTWYWDYDTGERRQAPIDKVAPRLLAPEGLRGPPTFTPPTQGWRGARERIGETVEGLLREAMGRSGRAGVDGTYSYYFPHHQPSPERGAEVDRQQAELQSWRRAHDPLERYVMEPIESVAGREISLRPHPQTRRVSDISRPFTPSHSEMTGRDKIDTGDATVIVVGGADDRRSRIGEGQYSEYYNAMYFEHGSVNNDKAILEIEQRAKGGPIILIGHSWGASEAYKAARALRDRGNNVVMLITADPVSKIRGSGPPPDTLWVNINAKTDSPDQSDWVAEAGGKPSRLPTDRAQINATVPGHHRELPEMMDHPLFDPRTGELRSAQQMIKDFVDQRRRDQAAKR